VNAPTVEGGEAPATNALLTLSDAHVVHKARTGGLFSRDRVYALTGADLKLIEEPVDQHRKHQIGCHMTSGACPYTGSVGTDSCLFVGL